MTMKNIKHNFQSHSRVLPEYRLRDTDFQMHEMDDYLPLQKQSKQNGRQSPLIRGCIYITTLLAAILLIIFAQSLYVRSGSCHQISLAPKPYEKQPHHCGKSKSEAISAGCRFDLISFSWLPPECFD